jgi:hypothetical protein
VCVQPLVVARAREAEDCTRGKNGDDGGAVRTVQRPAHPGRPPTCIFDAVVSIGSPEMTNEPLDWTDAHHLRHWLHGGPTALDNLVLVCKLYRAPDYAAWVSDCFGMQGFRGGKRGIILAF